LPRRRPLALQLDDAAPGRWICDCLECLAQALDVITRHRIPQALDGGNDNETSPEWRAI
jgi:hypothetical protein